MLNSRSYNLIVRFFEISHELSPDRSLLFSGQYLKQKVFYKSLFSGKGKKTLLLFNDKDNLGL